MVINKKKSRVKKFSTKVLDDSLRNRKFMLETKRQHLLQRVLKLMDELSLNYPFKEAYIFGSLAEKGKFDDDSDVDIGFVGLKSEDVLKLTAFFSNELGRDVDILQLEGTRFEKKAKEGIRWNKNRSLS